MRIIAIGEEKLRGNRGKDQSLAMGAARWCLKKLVARGTSKKAERPLMFFKKTKRCLKTLKDAEWNGAKGVGGKAMQ